MERESLPAGRLLLVKKTTGSHLEISCAQNRSHGQSPKCLSLHTAWMVAMTLIGLKATLGLFFCNLLSLYLAAGSM